MEEMEGMGKRGTLVHQELRGRGEWLVLVDQLGITVYKETRVLKESQDCRAHKQEEQSTLAGAGPPAPLARELSFSMPAELEGHLGSIQEEQQTICVYQMILTISSTRLEYRELLALVERSIIMVNFHLSLLLTVTMFPVLCAMWPTEVWQ